MAEVRCNKSLFMFVDYRGGFYHSARYKDANMNVHEIRRHFSEAGYDLIVRPYSEVDFRSQNYRGQYILYQSSEDRELLYKSYIEDILLGLEIQGAILIPNFYLFRAHHNKVFMEILRDLSLNPLAGNVQSKGFGTYEDFVAQLSLFPDSVVMKPSEGAMSTDIKKLVSDKSKLQYTRKLSNSFHFVDAAKNLVKSYVRRPYLKKSNYRRKFVVQNFVPDLQNDYKVLVYGDCYYVLLRQNRKNDFRASGSGQFTFIESLPNGLLNYAEQVFKSFHTPYISLDIGYSNGKFYLFEFQAVSFGSFTLIASPFYFMQNDQGWRVVHEKSNLEQIFVQSVTRYLERG